jgi:hypothetical protein
MKKAKQGGKNAGGCGAASRSRDEVWISASCHDRVQTLLRLWIFFTRSAISDTPRCPFEQKKPASSSTSDAAAPSKKKKSEPARGSGGAGAAARSSKEKPKQADAAAVAAGAAAAAAAAAAAPGDSYDSVVGISNSWSGLNIASASIFFTRSAISDTPYCLSEQEKPAGSSTSNAIVRSKKKNAAAAAATRRKRIARDSSSSSRTRADIQAEIDAALRYFPSDSGASSSNPVSDEHLDSLYNELDDLDQQGTAQKRCASELRKLASKNTAARPIVGASDSAEKVRGGYLIFVIRVFACWTGALMFVDADLFSSTERVTSTCDFKSWRGTCRCKISRRKSSIFRSGCKCCPRRAKKNLLGNKKPSEF